MKRFIILLTIILLVAILSGCSSGSSLELKTSNVTITNDKDIAGAVGITEGEKKGRELVPTVLYYKFTIKNVGHKNREIDKYNDLQVKIEPNDKLKKVSQEIVGINIFEPDSYMSTGLGYGESIYGSMLKPGGEGEIILTYDLGVSEESPNATLITPSEEKLEKLLDYALDASLIIILKDTEIARFNLNKK